MRTFTIRDDHPSEMGRREKLKIQHHYLSMFVASALFTSGAFADIYSDPVGDIATGNRNLDITSVEMTHNGSDLLVTITVDLLDADWGKYMVFMDFGDNFQGNFGAPDNNNPWARNVSGHAGFDAFTGIWLDDNGGGMSQHSFTGGSWAENYTSPLVNIDYGANSFTLGYMDYVYYLQNYGVTEIGFEVGTTGGNVGDPAIDLLGNEDVQFGWGHGSSITDLQYFTIPAPGALALLGLAGLAGRRRRR